MIDYKTLKNKKTFFLIAGPCVVESKELVFKVCNVLKKITDKQKIPFVFKASYSKANRTSAKSFRSIGVDKALDILSKVRTEFDVPVLTDVHSELDVELAAEVVDILQIPAFLSRQTELLEAAGNTGKIVNIKKGQFLSPFDMNFQVEKVALTGNRKILLTERGSTFGYNNLVVDFRGLPVMKNFGYPVVFDATHSVQMPSKENGVSGGNPEFIEPLAKAAIAAGADGIFIETHTNPSKALSDGSNMIKLTNVQDLLIKLKRVFNAVNIKA